MLQQQPLACEQQQKKAKLKKGGGDGKRKKTQTNQCHMASLYAWNAFCNKSSFDIATRIFFEQKINSHTHTE